MIWIVRPGSGFFYLSRIPDPGVQKAPDPGSRIRNIGCYGTQSFFLLLQAHDKLTGMSINNVAQIMQKTLALVKPLAEGGGADKQLLKSLQAGLAIKNPPKKPKKTHLKNPLKMFFWVFFKCTIFYKNNTNFSF